MAEEVLVEPTVSLKQLIKQKWVTPRETPFLVPGGKIRASSIPDLCPREEVLRAIHEVVRKEKIEADLNLVFEHGKALHSQLQNSVLPYIDVLWGRWRCLRCGKMYGEAKPGKSLADCAVPRPEKCSKKSCGESDFRYEEYDLVSEEFRITGHPDGFLKLPGRPGLGILEAKSISPAKSWKVKQIPDMGHMVQAHIYLWLTGLQWTVILYWDKGAFGMNGLIEHFIERDEETVENIKKVAGDLWAILDPIWEAKKAGKEFSMPVLPERICGNPDCDRAEKCAVVAQCFKETP